MTEGGVLDDDGGRSCCCCCCCCFTSSSVRPPLLAHPDFLCALFRSRRPPPGRRTIARRTKTGRPVARRRRRRGRTRWRRRRRFDRPCVRASTGRLLQAPCDVREAGYPRCVAVVSFPKPRSDCRHVRGKALQRRDAVRRSGASSRVLGLKRRAGVSHGLGSSRNVSAPSLKLLTATVAPLRELTRTTVSSSEPRTPSVLLSPDNQPVWRKRRYTAGTPRYVGCATCNVASALSTPAHPPRLSSSSRGLPPSDLVTFLPPCLMTRSRAPALARRRSKRTPAQSAARDI